MNNLDENIENKNSEKKEDDKKNAETQMQK